MANSNANVGANYLELGVQSYNVRGLGLFTDTEDIANVAIVAKNGTPSTSSSLARSASAPKRRWGASARTRTTTSCRGWF